MRNVHPFVITVLTGVIVGGCAQKRTPAPAPSAVVTAPVAAPTADESMPDRVKRPRYGDAAVYIDGKTAGVLRRTELPPKLQGKVIPLAGGYETTRYTFTDYARALGIDPKKVKALHLHGGTRVSAVDEAEFKRIGDRLMFSFVQGDRGKPRVHYPGMKLNVNTTIDMLSAVTFYVEKAPPTVKDRGELVMPDGTDVTGKVPYAEAEQGNGTRVYVDGQLAGTVKRKKLTAELMAPKADDDKGEDRYSLLAYATQLRPEAAKAKVVDLVAGDDIVAHTTDAKALTFQVPRRNRGQALVQVPTTDGKKPARISAVQIFINTTPPSRPVVKLDEAAEAAPVEGSGGGGGGDEEP